MAGCNSFPDISSSSFLYPTKANNVYTNSNNNHVHGLSQAAVDRVNNFNKENSTGGNYPPEFPASNDNIRRNYLTPPGNRSLAGAESLTPISQQNLSHNSSYAGNMLLERPDRTVIYKDLAYLQEMLAAEKEKSDALTVKLQSLQNEITDMVMEKNGLKKKNEGLQLEIEKLREQAARDSNKQIENNLRSALEYLQRERDSLEKESREQGAKHKNELEQKAVELSNLRKIIDAYQNNSFPKLDDPLVNENQRLAKELDMIKGVLKDYKELEGSCEDLIKENERMNLIIMQKSNEIEELKAKMQKASILNISNLSSATATSNYLPVELERKIADMIEENCSLNAEKQQLQKEFSLLQEKLKKIVETNEKLNEIVEEHDRSVRALTKKNCELEEEIVGYKKHVKIVTTAFEARVKDLEVEKDEQKRRNEELMMEKDRFLQNSEGFRDAEETIKDLKRKLVTVIEENDKLNQVLMNKLEEVEMIKKVEAKMETLIKENQNLRTDIINKNYEVEYWQKRVVDSKL